MTDARSFLDRISQSVASDFVANRSLMSFDEYMEEVIARPRCHCRSAAQYLKDMFDFYGEEEVRAPQGVVRRFKLFDTAFVGGRDRVVGQEAAQNEMYRVLNNFVRERRVTRMVLLHGPNGSAKTSFTNALIAGLEHYSKQPQGALYRFHWVFPNGKMSRGAIGFGDSVGEEGERLARGVKRGEGLRSYALLDDVEIDAKLAEELRDSPLLLLPAQHRQALLLELFGQHARSPGEPPTEDARVTGAEGGGADSDHFILSDYLYEGRLSHKSRKIFDALLASYHGDYKEVLKHVQVERFYISARYRCGAITIEPQLRTDAATRQVTADRSLSALPTSLQTQALFEPMGDLVDGNRGLIAFNDMLKRPMEMNKYLLSTSEKASVPLEHANVYLDVVLMGSANEDYLEAFKGTPDYASFKGRLSLVRMPYLLDYRVERCIYDQLLERTDLGAPIAPHTTEVAALWAVLTRLRKPHPEQYPASVQELIARLTPMDKALLYASGKAPEGLSADRAKELRAQIQALFAEGQHDADYEGSQGISPRDMKAVLLHAAQRGGHGCLSPLALFEELQELIRDPSVYPFLRLKADGAYHKPADFIAAVKGYYVDTLDLEVRSCMGLVDEARYEDYLSRYIMTVSHWVKGEKLYNRITGKSEEPSEPFMGEVEKALGVTTQPKVFRQEVISKIGAFRVDNPSAELAFDLIFPDLLGTLKERFFKDRRKQVKRLGEHLLARFAGEAEGLSAADAAQVESTLQNMYSTRGYDPVTARAVVPFLIRERYAS
jgi:serine protein kinase